MVPVIRRCQSPIWIWLVNYLHLHLHLHVYTHQSPTQLRAESVWQCQQISAVESVLRMISNAWTSLNSCTQYHPHSSMCRCRTRRVHVWLVPCFVLAQSLLRIGCKEGVREAWPQYYCPCNTESATVACSLRAMHTRAGAALKLAATAASVCALLWGQHAHRARTNNGGASSD